MKYFLSLLCSVLLRSAIAHGQPFSVYNLSLPREISYYDNQFSGLYVHANKLFIMSESRLQDRAEGKLYAISLADLDKKISDSSYILPYKKFHIYKLEVLRDKINAAGQSYEGLEAFVIDGKDIYFSVETATPSDNCYLLKGILTDTAVIMNTDFLIAMPKPVNADGKHIYNAGFEAIAKKDKQMFSFFEYNYFSAGNKVYLPLSKASSKNKITINSLPISKIPFRITDITATGKNHYTAINYFFKGEGDDTVYRMPGSDTANNLLTRDKSGYKNYCRLIDIEFNGKSFSWKPFWEFPTQYMDYNWEGLAAYKSGYFIMNDKYSPKRPYISTLLYFKK